jgi:hypothetical protein
MRDDFQFPNSRKLLCWLRNDPMNPAGNAPDRCCSAADYIDIANASASVSIHDQR